MWNIDNSIDSNELSTLVTSTSEFFFYEYER